MQDATTNESNNPRSGKTPVVSRVVGDTIVELVYDAERRQTGLAASRFGGLWNIEQEIVLQGETCIPYSPQNNLIRTECILFPSKPVHHGDKAELLGEIERYIHRYVDISPLFERVASHYVLLSWVYDALNELPYLRLQGDFGCGKTRALLTIGSIMYKPFFSSGASTVSPLFHILDAFGGSLVLDEADYRFSDATTDLVKILNGTTRGLPVLRTMQDRHRELNPRAFRVYGPKLVAMRSAFADQGLESRFISEAMPDRDLRPDIPIHLPDTLRTDALALRNKLLHYRFTALFLTRINPGHRAPGDDPRASQVMLPLLSVVDDSELRDAIRSLVLGQAAQIPRDGGRKQVVKAIQNAMTELFADPRMKTAVLADVAGRVNEELGGHYTVKQIGSVLRTVLRISTHKSHGNYIVPRRAFEKHQDEVRGQTGQHSS